MCPNKGKNRCFLNICLSPALPRNWLAGLAHKLNFPPSHTPPYPLLLHSTPVKRNTIPAVLSGTTFHLSWGPALAVIYFHVLITKFPVGGGGGIYTRGSNLLTSDSCLNPHNLGSAVTT